MSEPCTPEGNTLEDLILIRLSRRQALRVGALAGAGVAIGGVLARVDRAGAATPKLAPPIETGSISPVPLSSSAAAGEVVAPGYESKVLVRWGDPILPGAPAFDLDNQTAAAQAQQFGFNCDYVHVGQYGDDYILWVNHEYSSGEGMIPGYPAKFGAYTPLDLAPIADLTRWTDIELAAHGGSIIRLNKTAHGYEPDFTSPLNRRITGTTPMKLTGPASTNPNVGTDVLGMLNQCAGGYTPWGTILTTEENFNQYFARGSAATDPVAATDHAVYGIPNGPSDRRWDRVYDRFDCAVNQYEPWKFGYVVEIDPTDPTSTPTKRTALGRTKHECANTAVAPDGRVAVYTGDDERFQYFYKFVTKNPWNPTDRAANFGLLDEGTLYVARLDADGTGQWLPLVYAGNEPAFNAVGLTSQADICIHTRQAAAALGATKMDRPEDIEVSPVTGYVYVACTNNTNRGVAPNPGPDAANPRAVNRYGHIIELVEDNGNASADEFVWDIFMLCGHGENTANLVADPAAASTTEQTYFGGYTQPTTLIGSPDNLAFDKAGNLFVGSDGMPSAPVLHCDGAFVVPVAGAQRGHLQQLYAVPAEAESTGPFVSDDDTVLFIAVQHPGENSFAVPADPRTNSKTKWPDGDYPRPSVVQIHRTDHSKLVKTPTAKLIPLSPTRVLDTRDGTGVAAAGKVPADGTVVAGIDGLTVAEATSIAALILNTTLTEANGAGYLTVYPSPSPRPYASAINVERTGQTKANLVTVPVGPAGGVTIYSFAGGHVVADLNGVYVYVTGSKDGRYQALNPTRLFDTRDGTGGVPAAKLAAGAVLEVQVAGRAGVPATGASAVLVNVTMTEPDGPGYLTVFPEGSPPYASNLNNDAAGEHIPNQVVVPLGADGKIRVFTYAATHVLGDVSGWITDDTAEDSDVGLFVPVVPFRSRDTRDGKGGTMGKIAAGGTTVVPVAGVGGVPATGVAAVVGNLTFTETDAAGYVTAYPSGTPRPYASSINASTDGQTIANHVTVPVGADGTITLFCQNGGHLVFDITGWYTAADPAHIH